MARRTIILNIDIPHERSAHERLHPSPVSQASAARDAHTPNKTCEPGENEVSEEKESSGAG